MDDRFLITGIGRVIMVGKNEYPEERTVFSRRLKQNELIFHFSGQTTVFFNDQTLETAPDTVRFLPAGENSRYEVIRRARGECIDVFFKTDRPVAPEAFVRNVSQTEIVGSLFKRLFAVWVSKDEGYYFESLSLLYRIFSELQKNPAAPKQHVLKIRAALDLIHDFFLKKDLSLAEMSDACGISASYFQRLFREKYGISPKKYVIRLKINHACDLLRLERYSVTRVAEICRFSDVYYFSRQFKKEVGLTPTQYVRKYRSSR